MPLDHDPYHVEEVRIPGGKIALQHDGRTLRVVTPGYAPYYARIEEERLRYGEPVTRACLRCSEPFLSEGKHNRLCRGCQRSPLGREWS